MSEWPGYIPREKLIEFSQKRVEELRIENAKIWDAMNGKNVTDEDYETFFAKHYSNIGEILSLRRVCEWARDHKRNEDYLRSQEVKISSQEDLKNQYDGV